MLDAVVFAGVTRGKFGEKGLDFAVSRGDVFEGHDKTDGVVED